MLEKLKESNTFNGEAVNDFLVNKYNGEGEWLQLQNEELVFNVNVLGHNKKYKWRVVDSNIVTVNGRAADLTPQYDVDSIKLLERKKELDESVAAIYENVKKLEENGLLVEEAIELVSSEMGISVQQVENAYVKANSIIYPNE